MQLIDQTSSAGLSEDTLPELQARFGLTYHLRWAMTCQRELGFKGKDVLEVGGSLPEELVLGVLGARSWTALEAAEYYQEITAPGQSSLDEITSRAPRTFDALGPGPFKPEGYQLLLGHVESLPRSMEQRFDLIFSVAAFEHISRFGEALRKMYNVLKPGGWVFALASPLWSCPIGHHIPEITDAKGRTFTFHDCPIPPHGHLLLRPPELYSWLLKHTDPVTADQIVYYVHHSPQINRLFTEDYQRWCALSPFEEKQVILTGRGQVAPNVQKMLETLYPGRRAFDNAGVLMCLRKGR